MLTGQGLINRVTLTPGAARFDPNATPHHHFVCAHCRLIRDVQSTELDAIQPPTDVLGIGLPDAVTVQFTGICFILLALSGLSLFHHERRSRCQMRAARP